MDREETNEMLNRYLADQASEQDKMLVESWYLNLNEDLTLQTSVLDRLSYLEEIKAALDQRFAPATSDQETQVIDIRYGVNTNWSYIIAVAAIIICVLCIVLYPAKKTDQQQDPVLVLNKDIQADENKAFLLLSDGTKINLAAVKAGLVATQHGSAVTKLKNGELLYENKSAASSGRQYNQIETPKGGVYQVQLPDGTKVWLNAASTLRYPTSFSSLKERRVELSGEAYFEVAKNKLLPFRVMAHNQEVEVLGTHFNINSYPEEGAVKTTLLEGRIRINNSNVLKAGEQAVNDGSNIKVAAIDAESTVDWKNGKFSFNNGQDFRGAMRQIERWYDVEFVYAIIPDIEPRGRLPRNTGLLTVLHEIEGMGNVHFIIEGRRIIVTH
jgi:transmembrane sensor